MMFKDRAGASAKVRIVLSCVFLSFAAGAVDFWDDFERADTPAGILGVSPTGAVWKWLNVGGWVGTNAAIRSGRLIPNYSEPSRVYYACVQPPRPATEVGATIVWEEDTGMEVSMATFIIAGWTNSAHYWGLHAGVTRFGWRIGYLPEPPFRDIVLASGSFAEVLNVGESHSFSFRLDPDGCFAQLGPAGAVRVGSTNFWHYAMHTAGTNWAVWEMYCGDAANMVDRVEYESVYANNTVPVPRVSIADGRVRVDCVPDLPGFALESAASLEGPWTPLSVREVDELLEEAPRFYRVNVRRGTP